MNTSNPSAQVLHPIVTTLPIEACTGPSRFYRALRSHRATATPTCLLESSTEDVHVRRRSILGVHCPVRVILEGSTARIIPLTAAAAPIVEVAAARLRGADASGGELVWTLDRPDSDSEDDANRLRCASVLDALRTVAGLFRDRGDRAPLPPGLFGAFGYEIVDAFESLPARAPDPLGEPDACFLLATDQVVFEHTTGEVHVITRALPGEDPRAADDRHMRNVMLLRTPGAEPALPEIGATTAPRVDVEDAEFLAGVERIQAHIARGDVFQTVLSRGFAVDSDACSLDVYAALRAKNPSPYMFHIDLPDGCLLGASPETFLRCEDGEVEIRPIAGTVPRGVDEDEDRRLALRLLLDPKEQAEHAMLLDLARNDVARIAEPGSMRVVQQFAIEKYSHVQHLVSRVRGRLREGLDALHAYRAAANMGTLTGAPKLRAMELIRELEPTSRGFYGGAAGYLLADGRFDSCIVIRSLRQKGGTYYTRAGAGVVHASVPERELEETAAKAAACLEAVARATATAPKEVTP